MSSEPTPTRRPIAAVRISTIALLGIVAAVAVPACAAAIVLSGTVDSKQVQQNLGMDQPVSRVVIVDSDSSVHVTANPALFGVSGQATLSWHAFSGTSHAKVVEQYADGVLTLSKDCGGIDCGADIDIQVPPKVSVQVNTSNAGISVTGVLGAVDLHSSNASITAKQLGSGDATLATQNASIHASFTGAPKSIRATTSNASVSIVTDGHTPYYDDVKTSNGDTNLQNVRDRRSANVLYIHTSSGGITVK
ncbi:hypothetical protein Caci_1363 [Catenulispora acidiphila DSM 44928]|uniref:Adhesin domain-containing protein n=1 Tax=Catenulispora acidiphila (strain DSM 44928 / JCM 14897 / NBRC 102108 / NRRL B-24433 / ID139908) TaxID=479433 RepID=C7Q8M1_CATAD|nr:hypothetical protein [Catenulispora acidiphila]ACU70286.1 hypothetical protein Caci_1363 [Catenulispora acidiphila DSM 44928]